MVRINKDLAGEPSVNLTEELQKAGTWTGETSYPPYAGNAEPVDIKGDIEPEKKTSKPRRASKAK